MRVGSWIITLLWLPVIFALCPTALAQYRFDHWTADTGLPQNIITAIHQTRDGYLWVATLDGLARFDGVRFTIFDKSNSPGIAGNRFNSLYEDRDGDLWAGTENGGLTRYTRGVFTTYTTQHGLTHNFIREVTGDESGNLWVLSAEQIVRWDRGRFVPVELPGLKVDFQNSEWNSRVFIGADKTNLYRFAHGRLTTWPLPGDLLGRITNRFEEDPSGVIWILMLGGKVARIKDGKALNVSRVSEAPPGQRTGKMAEMEITYRDRQGNPWTIGVGKELIRSLALPSSGRLEKISFRAFCEDREGNLWLGTDGQGLYRVRKQAITTYSKPQGLVDRNAYAIYEDRSGAIWIGAWQGGLSRFREGSFTSFTSQDGLASGLVTALYEDRAGRLWAGAHHDRNGGLRILKLGQDGRFTTISDRILPDRTLVAAIHEDRAGAFWFGTTRGLARYQDGVSTIYTAKDGLAGDDVRVIIEDAAGRLWIGAYGGLTRLTDGRFTAWTERDGLPSNNVRALYLDREGVLWIGTYDGGLGRFKDGRFTRYTTRDGLFNNGVFQILEDARGRFWMSSNRGIHRVSKQELDEFAGGKRSAITSIAYGRSDGMLNVECNGGQWPAGIRARDGKLWFPTQDGVAVIDPEAMPTNPQPPPVIIEAVKINNESVPLEHWESTIRNPQSAIRIQPNQENFEIQYTALSFINAENLRFRYKLEGLDHHWVEAGTRRMAYYPHVPAGDYTFRVIAANSDGVWNEEGRSLRVVVLPPFYRTWWFLTPAVLLVGGAIVAAFKYRVAQLERRQAAQQAFARQLIESQESERKRIAAELHDSLGQSLAIIKNRALLSLSSPDDHDRALEQLREISEASAQVIVEAKEIAHNLRPYQLDRIGLTKTIKGMIERIAETHDLRFKLELDNIDGLLPPESEINLFRIVQEGVNNIVRHAEATEAGVLIKRTAQRVELTIADNGKGFTAGAARASGPLRRGFGLIGIAERVRVLGGDYDIHPVPGRGTTITITISLKDGQR